MTRKQALNLQGYFLEMETGFIETCNFCNNRSDNALLSTMVQNGEIERYDEDGFILTQKGRKAYKEITGKEAPEDNI